jgi:hypothetical protein
MSTDIATQNDGDRSWSFQVNLSGVAAANSVLAMEEGYYKVTVTDAYVKPEKPGRVVIKVKVLDGQSKGAVRTTGINLPNGEAKDYARNLWRGLLESVGHAPNVLDNGELQLSSNAIVNRNAFIYYVPSPGEGSYDRVDFLPPAIWKERSENFVPGESHAPAAPAASRAEAAAPAITPASTPAAVAGTATRSSILSKLGAAPN